MALPKAVADCLGIPCRCDNIQALEGALAWLARQPRRALRDDPGHEVVYQAYLGPFLGFADEPGTLESLVCFLPFIVEKLCATSVIFLPLLQRGRTRKKGATGSPFAVADFAQLEQSHSAFLDVAPINEVWRLIVAAMHDIGVRMGMNLPLATIAIDAPEIREMPSLVYWWRAHPAELLTGSPAIPTEGAFWNEAVPVASAQHRFVPPPSPEDVRMMSIDGQDFFVAEDFDGNLLVVANAYPDPIVRDAATYAWSDVAAIRFGAAHFPTPYTSSRGDGNPESSNEAAERHVLRAIGERLSLGETILFADVSSALPAESLSRSLPPYPELALAAEQLWTFAERPPFDFVLGPLIPCVAAQWASPETIANSLAHHLRLLAATEKRKWHFGGVANHDTLPCPPNWTRALLTIFVILPRSVPFLYSGTEFGCGVPTNLEFGARPDGYAWPSDEQLLLFSPRPIPLPDFLLEDFTQFWADLLLLRNAIADINDGDGSIEEVLLDRLVVSGRVGRASFVVNCGKTNIAHTPPAERNGDDVVFLSAAPVQWTDRKTSVPSESALIALPDCGRTRELIPKLACFSVTWAAGAQSDAV